MVTATQKDKAEKFLQYHLDEEILVLLNTWDKGTSKLVEACGYKAIATTSMGVAATMGYPDCQVMQLEELLPVLSGIVQAVQLPVTVDFEAGYGNTLEEILYSVKQAISTGIVGINIEDSVDMQPELTDEKLFCERISAIRALSDSLGFHLVINARTDAFYTKSGTPQENLHTSIRRGNLYTEAGADCIFVQPVWDKETIATLVKEIDAPVNILANPSNGGGLPPSVQELQDLGVARLSMGSSVMKATLALVRKIADSVRDAGSYELLMQAVLPIPQTVSAYKMAVGMKPE
ncbi:MAG: isocitrate lyase/phosphoenolpyruvate mutase family protein [Chitinophagales bacterium]